MSECVLESDENEPAPPGERVAASEEETKIVWY